MTVRDWLKNREDFKNRNKKDYNKRAKKARDEYRKKYENEQYKKYRKKGLDNDVARQKAKNDLNGKSALHNPDGIAGGKVTDVTKMGNSRINQSIGSQWADKSVKIKGSTQRKIMPGRAQSIETQIRNLYNVPPKPIDSIPVDEMMNVDLF